MATLANLVVNITGNTGKLVASLKDGESRIDKFAKKHKTAMKGIGIGILAAGAAAGGAIIQFGKLGDEVQKMSFRTGFSTEALSELRFALQQAGSSVEGLEKGVRRMSSFLEDSKDGLTETTRAMEKLGLSVEDFTGLKPEEAFFKFTDALAAIPDELTQAALAQDVFGRSGTALLPLLAEGAEGIAALRQEARDLGIVFDQETANKAAKMQDSINSAKQAMNGMAIEIGTVLAPAVTAIANGFATMPGILQKVTAAAVGLFVAIRVGLRSTKAALIGSGIGAALVAMGVAFELISRKLGLFGSATSEATEELRALNVVAAEAAKLQSDLADRMDELFIAAGRGGSELTEQAAAIDAIGESLRDLFTIRPGDFMGEGLAATRKQIEDIIKTIDRTGLTFNDLRGVIQQVDGEFSIFGARVENFGGIMDALHRNTARTTEANEASISVWEQVAQSIDDMTKSIGSSSEAVISFGEELERFARSRFVEERVAAFKQDMVGLRQETLRLNDALLDSPFNDPEFGTALRDGMADTGEVIVKTAEQIAQLNNNFLEFLQATGQAGRIQKTGARATTQIGSFREAITGGEALNRLLKAIEQQARLFQSGRANTGVGGGVLIGGAGKLLGFGQDQRTGRLRDADILKSILDRVRGLSDLQIGKIGGLLELLRGQGRGIGSALTNFLAGSGLSSGVAGGAAAEFGGSKGDINIVIDFAPGAEDFITATIVKAKAAGADV